MPSCAIKIFVHYLKAIKMEWGIKSYLKGGLTRTHRYPISESILSPYLSYGKIEFILVVFLRLNENQKTRRAMRNCYMQKENDVSFKIKDQGHRGHI